MNSSVYDIPYGMQVSKNPTPKNLCTENLHSSSLFLWFSMDEQMRPHLVINMTDLSTAIFAGDPHFFFFFFHFWSKYVMV